MFDVFIYSGLSESFFSDRKTLTALQIDGVATAVCYHAGQCTSFVKNICMHLYGSRHTVFQSSRLCPTIFPFDSHACISSKTSGPKLKDFKFKVTPYKLTQRCKHYIPLTVRLCFQLESFSNDSPWIISMEMDVLTADECGRDGFMIIS